MSKNINKISLALLVSLLGATAAWASDVYIDQAGSTTTIDITQTGASNTADIETATGASDTKIDYTATGGSNILDVDISTATDTTITATITGDSNELTVCGSLATDAAAAASATCATEVSANTTTTNVAITGDGNKVAAGLDSASAVNNITIGANTVSDYNVVNLKQTGTDVPVVTLNVDGSSNAVNITQN